MAPSLVVHLVVHEARHHVLTARREQCQKQAGTPVLLGSQDLRDREERERLRWYPLPSSLHPT